jgi:purine-binding chemotaxis protein CheW
MNDGRPLVLATEETYLQAGRDKDMGPVRPVLTFVVGGEHFGVPLGRTREIIKLREITEVPRMPRFLLGVVSVRGVVIPVIDLRLRLRIEATPLTRAARIVIVTVDNEPFGLLCDAVAGVVRLPEAQLEATPASLGSGEGGFIDGIGRFNAGRRERLVALFNLATLVSFEVRRRSAKREGK